MMANTGTSTEQGIGGLAQGALADVEKLIGQHIDLLRRDLKEELCRVKGAAFSLAGGAGVSAVGGLLGILALVHALHAATRLPLWACYGLVGGVLGGTGAALLRHGARQAADVHLVPPRTASVLREELAGA